MLRQDAGAQAQQKLSEDPGSKLPRPPHASPVCLGAIGVARRPVDAKPASGNEALLTCVVFGSGALGLLLPG
jgi:hypothetical protein